MKEYHRVYAEVDLGAIKNNIISIKNSVPSHVGIMPVVKADSYGHGSVEVSKTVLDYADAFGVATIEEAVELRNIGIKKPILILGTLSAMHFEEAILNDITISVYTDEMAKALSACAESLKTNAKIHIATDTGMNRIGVKCSAEGLNLVKKICSYPCIDVKGIFSHFATADDTDKTIAMNQRECFEKFCTELENEGIHIECKHMCNSAASCSLNDKLFSMIRPGIIIYGLYPSPDINSDYNLKPALSLKSHVSYIKKVHAGEGISYGHTYIADRDRIIATVPVGYADGYPRLLSNRGRVIINGKYAPIVGRVCMDQFMVDITNIDGVKIEDTVTLIGTDGESTVTADEIADICSTINYEIICGIGKRVPRVYK